jgi:hypothetical protein
MKGVSNVPKIKSSHIKSNRQFFIARLQLIGMSRDKRGYYYFRARRVDFRIRCRKMTFVIYQKSITYYDDLSMRTNWVKVRTVYYTELDRELLVNTVKEMISLLTPPSGDIHHMQKEEVLYGKSSKK